MTKKKRAAKPTEEARDETEETREPTEERDETEAAREPTEGESEPTDEPRDDADDADDAPKDEPSAKGARKVSGEKAGREDFAKDFPSDPALAKLLVAFDRGDYFTVRRDAEAVAEKAKDPRVAKAARDLRARIDPAPTASLLLLVGLALAVFVGGYFLLKHEHREPSEPPTSSSNAPPR